MRLKLRLYFTGQAHRNRLYCYYYGFSKHLEVFRSKIELTNSQILMQVCGNGGLCECVCKYVRECVRECVRAQQLNGRPQQVDKSAYTFSKPYLSLAFDFQTANYELYVYSMNPVA